MIDRTNSLTNEELEFIEALSGKHQIPNKSFEKKLLHKLKLIEARKKTKSWKIFVGYSFAGLFMVFFAFLIVLSLYSPNIDKMLEKDRSEIYLTSQEEKKQIILAALDNTNTSIILEKIFIPQNTDKTDLNNGLDSLNFNLDVKNINLAPIELNSSQDSPTSFINGNFVNFVEKNVYIDDKLLECFSDIKLPKYTERLYSTQEFGDVIEVATEKSSYIYYKQNLDFVISSNNYNSRVIKIPQNNVYNSEKDMIDEDIKPTNQIPVSYITSFTFSSDDESNQLFNELESNLGLNLFDVRIVKINSEEFYELFVREVTIPCQNKERKLSLLIELDKSSFEPKKIKYQDEDYNVLIEIDFEFKSVEKHELLQKIDINSFHEQDNKEFHWHSDIVDLNFLSIINSIPNDLAKDLVDRIELDRIDFGEIAIKYDNLDEPVRFSAKISNQYADAEGQDLITFLKNHVANSTSYTVTSDNTVFMFKNLELKMI